MAASDWVPLVVRKPTPEALIKEIARIQSIISGKVAIISIQQDLVKKDWVCFYLPPKSLGLGAV